MANTLKEKLIKSVKSKRINIFLMFLILSFVILILTKLSRTYTNTISFSVVELNVPEAVVIINDSTPILNISLKTKGFNFLKYYFNEPNIVLDFSTNIHKADSSYIWNNKTAYSSIIRQFDKDVEVLNINPDTLVFRYDENDVKKIPVVLNSDINYKPGYDLLKEFQLNPDSVKLVGPKSILSKIKHIETDTLQLNNIYSKIETTVKLNLPKDYEQIKFNPNEVIVSGDVDRFSEGKIKVPLEVINVPDSIKIKYFPKAVTISYYTNLSNFKSVKRESFRVVCDYKTIKDNQSFLKPEIVEKPDNVKHLRLNLKQVEFIITE